MRNLNTQNTFYPGTGLPPLVVSDVESQSSTMNMTDEELAKLCGLSLEQVAANRVR